MADRPRDDLTPDETDRLTSTEILELLSDIEQAVQTVKLYVADALLRPETEDDGGNAGW